MCSFRSGVTKAILILSSTAVSQSNGNIHPFENSFFSFQSLFGRAQLNHMTSEVTMLFEDEDVWLGSERPQEYHPCIVTRLNDGTQLI